MWIFPLQIAWTSPDLNRSCDIPSYTLIIWGISQFYHMNLFFLYHLVFFSLRSHGLVHLFNWTIVLPVCSVNSIEIGIQYRQYLFKLHNITVSFIGRGHQVQSKQRKPLTCGKSLTYKLYHITLCQVHVALIEIFVIYFEPLLLAYKTKLSKFQQLKLQK